MGDGDGSQESEARRRSTMRMKPHCALKLVYNVSSSQQATIQLLNQLTIAPKPFRQLTERAGELEEEQRRLTKPHCAFELVYNVSSSQQATIQLLNQLTIAPKTLPQLTERDGEGLEEESKDV